MRTNLKRFMAVPQTPEQVLDVGLVFSFLLHTVIQPKFLLAKLCSWLYPVIISALSALYVLQLPPAFL